MVDSPSESTPLILLKFPEGTDKELLYEIEKHLVKNNIVIVRKDEKEKDGAILAVSTTHQELEITAEKRNIVLQTKPSKTWKGKSIMDRFTVEKRDRFLDDDEYFDMGLRIKLCLYILETITVLNTGEISNNLSRKLDDLNIEYNVEPMNEEDEVKTDTTAKEDTFNLTSETLLLILKQNEMIECVTPLHTIKERRSLFNKALNPMSPLPADEIRDYFGEEIAFYFAWLGSFTNWLVVPGIVGLLVYIRRMHTGDTVDTCELTPFFGVFMFLWVSLWLKFWDREEDSLAYRWGVYSTSTTHQGIYLRVRPEFDGYIRKSPVTGLNEKYFNPNKRYLRYVISAMVTLFMLTVAFTLMILSLNLQGYVHPGHNPDRWFDDSHHPFFYPMIASLAEDGQLFDANSDYMSFLPSILHVVLIQILNAVFRRVAEQLTDFENHEKFIAHENSLVLKRFLFEFFDAFIALFYLAFFERDIRKLRSELVMVFTVDTFRRLLLEYVIPATLRRIQGEESEEDKLKLGLKKKDDDYVAAPQNEEQDQYTDGDSTTKRLWKESTKDEYELFDDYLEMVIQFGYLTLFASAMPLASTFAVIANFVELRTDVTKLCKVLARPRAVRTDNIGQWKQLLNAILILSAFTNSYIFAFTSKQSMQFFPDFYYVDDFGDLQCRKSMCQYVFILIFGLEHLLIGLWLLIYFSIPTVPQDILDRANRDDYVKLQESNIRLLKQTGGNTSDSDS